MSSPIFDSTFGTGRFRREEAPFTPKEDRMTITDADLDYLRNINTSPGPNAGRSIDPTKPGPDADRASPEPQDVRQALELQLFDLVELARDTRSDKGGEAKWVHPCGALVKEFAKRIAALAQSDAGPPPLRYSDKAERAGDGTETRRLELAQSNAEPVAWQHMFDLLKAARQMACRAVTASGGLDATPRTMLDIAALIGEAEEGLLTKPPLYTAPPRPDASAGLADRGVHGELIPDCPTDGVAARQGNGG